MLEQNLLVAPYEAEWQVLGKEKDPGRYHPFTNVEQIVPWYSSLCIWLFFCKPFTFKLAGVLRVHAR